MMVNEYASHLTALYWPVLQNLGFSGGAGVAAGLTLKVRNGTDVVCLRT